MSWRKTSPELIALFDEVAPGDPIAERQKMFGFPCAFVNGNMFIGLHQENILLRLSEADREVMKSEHRAGPFEAKPGRAMKGYVSVP
ncbi:MAG: TfoX/Sxy family protein [Alphaproteobacteria bacterium]|nr:TfoX/Sxy family protein [Alphaproteobacteria bacterium]